MAEENQQDPQEGNREGLHKIGEVIEVIEEGDIVEVVEIEIYGRENKEPPRAKKYHIRIDKHPEVVAKRHIDGTELLAIVGKKPDAWRIFQKLHGGHMEEIQPTQVVDLGKKGIERFTTMEKAQRPGEQVAAATQPPPVAPRRAFRLPEEDEAFLDTLGLVWETIKDGNALWVLIHGYALPDGYNHGTVTLAIRIEGGYPPAPLDMAYVFPALARKDGKAIPQLSSQNLDGKNFQRWSRHYGWREGVDNFVMHYLRVGNWLVADAQ